MKTYKNFLFDFDGTLADSRKSISNSIRFALKKHDLPLVAPTDIFPLIGKKSIEDTFTHFYPKLSGAKVESLVKDFRAYQREHTIQETEIFPSVIQTLQTLKKQGHSLHILTTKEVGQITFVLNELKLADYFSIIYGNGLPYGKKPEKGCVEYILQTAGLKPHETVMVGDSSVDVQTARNGGIDVIGVTYGTDGEDGMRTAGATHIVRMFDELLQYSYNRGL
ncbi:MAG: HAD family hydrolase [Candidatus Woesebacteria bacterium]